MITKLQIRKIHIFQNLVGLDDETYRALLGSYGVNTSKDLSYRRAGELIEQLEKTAVFMGLCRVMTKRYDDLKNREDMATPKQLRKIEAMWREVAYQKDDEYVKVSLRRFLQRQFKISDLRFVEKSMVSKIIKAINSIQKQHSNAI